ncbi:hypothetical protein [Mediterranea massiliensis]|jgi:hypothetical protein|uniref:hypothetical protein n=1 Tax=Mediterranea massiliensis TaxID=1841865 RepID=UPI0025A40CAC|nr:hypothetical protein [Mediterranea massiliensis]MDM8336659.1 hypothetical protein [Mediterranea massiliensis]
MDKPIDTSAITLEDIALRKAELQKDIQEKKENIKELSRELFAPLEPATNKANAMMRAFNTGMAIYDGAMTGVKIVRRIRKLFRR